MLKIPIELYPKQFDFFDCQDKRKAFIGGIGSGKTNVGALNALCQASVKNSYGMIIAPTYGMLKDSSLVTFREIAGKSIKRFNKADMIIEIKGGGTILCRSADNPERLRGPNLDWVWIDEAGLCPAMTYDISLGRLRRGGKMGKISITTTPKGRNWVYQHINEMTVFRATTMDNPFLSQEFIDILLESYSDKFAQQELFGEFVTFEGLVYNMFDRDKHVISRNKNEFDYFVLCIDEGYVNPAAIAVMGIDKNAGFHVIEEWYKRGQLQSIVVENAIRLARKYKTKLAVVDPAASGLIADLRNSGLRAEFNQERVIQGINFVQNLLESKLENGTPRLTIDPSCVNGINEFESYIWRPGLDQVIKQNDHLLDAVRQFFNWLYSEQDMTIMVYNPVIINEY
jgi:PBSX family phage terminase large subunit